MAFKIDDLVRLKNSKKGIWKVVSIVKKIGSNDGYWVKEINEPEHRSVCVFLDEKCLEKIISDNNFKIQIGDLFTWKGKHANDQRVYQATWVGKDEHGNEKVMGKSGISSCVLLMDDVEKVVGNYRPKEPVSIPVTITKEKKKETVKYIPVIRGGYFEIPG